MYIFLKISTCQDLSGPEELFSTDPPYYRSMGAKQDNLSKDCSPNTTYVLSMLKTEPYKSPFLGPEGHELY